MSDNLGKEPLLISLFKIARLPFYWTTLIIAIILILLFILAGYLDELFAQGIEWEFWRGLLSPILITYILLIYPLTIRPWRRAIEAFRSLLNIEQKDYDKLLSEIYVIKRWKEYLAILAGFVFMLAISRPWSFVEGWMDVYQTVTSMIMFGLLGWLIFSSIYGNLTISKLSKQNLKLDIFNTNLLSPIAYLSLANSLAFIGGISISLVFQTQQNLLEWQTITIYSVLVIATILLFFMSMWNVHKILTRVKANEMQIAKEQLTLASRQLKDQISTKQKRETGQLSIITAGWASYVKMVQETPEWPFNAMIIRRLFASILAPASIYFLKILSTLGVKITF